MKVRTLLLYQGLEEILFSYVEKFQKIFQRMNSFQVYKKKSLYGPRVARINWKSWALVTLMSSSSIISTLGMYPVVKNYYGRQTRKETITIKGDNAIIWDNKPSKIWRDLTCLNELWCCFQGQWNLFPRRCSSMVISGKWEDGGSWEVFHFSFYIPIILFDLKKNQEHNYFKIKKCVSSTLYSCLELIFAFLSHPHLPSINHLINLLSLRCKWLKSLNMLSLENNAFNTTPSIIVWMHFFSIWASSWRSKIVHRISDF